MLDSVWELIKKGIPASKYYRSLMKSMFMIGFFLPFIPMILVGGIVFYQFHAAYEENVHTRLSEVVHKGKRHIDQFLKDRLSDLRFIAETFPFEELREESVLQDILRNLQMQHGSVFVELGVVDGKGVQVAYAGPNKSPEALSVDASWYREVMNADHVISDVSSSSVGLPHVTIAVRCFLKGEPWVLSSTIDYEALNKLVEDIRIGATGVALILNRDGQCQTRPLCKINPAKGTFMDFLGVKDKAKEDISIVQRTDDSGDESIYVTTFLKDGDWLLVYRESASEAFSGLRKARKVAFVIILLAALCIAANAVSLSKKMVRRIELADRKKEKMREQMFQTAKLASIGELASGIAHEINNPVATMVEEAGWIEDLLEEKEFQQSKNLSEFRRALKQICTQGERCKEITHKLLSFARRTDFRVQKVRLNELIEDIIAITGKRANDSDVVVIKDIQKDLPEFHVSPTELQQVFLNLINNALDAMERRGGTLSISAKLREDHIVIDVSDTGRGIPKEDLPRIFDPFFTTKSVGRGTGLGLSICYGIVKEMGGEIGVNSVVGNGTTFSIKIPISKQREDTKWSPSETRDSYRQSVNLYPEGIANGHSKRSVSR